MPNKNGTINQLLSQTARVFLLLFLPLFLSFHAVAQQPPEVSRAEALLREGKPAEAYALLAPLEDKFAGDPKFDYLLGIAALDSGKADRASLTFERVLAVDPNFAGARLDLARAYFQLGDMTRAKSEFNTVLGQNPPPAARAAINRYLELIAEREKPKRTNITGFIEATIGYDSNVNNSTSQSQITVPALGNVVFTLDPTNVKRGDTYTLFGVGGDVAHEILPGIALFGGVTGRYRANSSEDRFDFRSGDIRGGVAYAGEANIVRATVNGERYYLDHVPNRNTLGMGLDWRHIFNPANHLSVFGQHSHLRFENPALMVNNFDLSVLGLGWTRLFDDGRSSLSVTLLGGRENDLEDRADGNKDFYGVRLGGQLGFLENVDLFASFGHQKGDYDKRNAAFQATRDDKQLDGVVGLVWRIDPYWSVRPQALYIRNNSNIPIYAYKRQDFSVMLRRELK